MKFSSFFIIIFLWVSISCKNDNKQSKLEVPKILNLGKISLNDTIYRKFYIKNVSEKVVKIDSIVTDCGCTLVDFNKSSVKKRDSLEVMVKFIPDEIGQFQKSIIIDASTTPPFTIIKVFGEIK